MIHVSLCLGGDLATTRRYLDIASGTVSTLPDSDLISAPINVNCLDPLSRNALLIGLLDRI